jgi:hypothetical protein
MQTNNKLEKIIDLLLNHVYQPSCNQSTQKGQLVVDLEDSDGNCLGGLVLNGINEDDLKPFKD